MAILAIPTGDPFRVGFELPVMVQMNHLIKTTDRIQMTLIFGLSGLILAI